jgi:hypothetical protein
MDLEIIAHTALRIPIPSESPYGTVTAEEWRRGMCDSRRVTDRRFAQGTVAECWKVGHNLGALQVSWPTEDAWTEEPRPNGPSRHSREYMVSSNTLAIERYVQSSN